MKKNISILGATGSIGRSSLKILEAFPDRLKLIAISTNKNIPKLLELLDIHKPEYAVVSRAEDMKKHFGKYESDYKGIKIYSGDEGLSRICRDQSNNTIINGISGKAGLSSSIQILESSINLALANKESIVCAGPLLKELAKKNNTKILPVDSEHSALFQLLRHKKNDEIKCIYLTASGGPFFKLDKNKWHNITIEDALKHPTWKMGNKITIDSATMSNKGLEVIEAHFLFDMDYSRIKVLIHPQSLIHSMVETIDSNIYAQLGPSDMAIPIQNAVFYPELLSNLYKNLDLSKNLMLELYPVDMDKFKMLQFAYLCGEKGKLYPAFYNYVNEILTYLFLEGKITFLQIEEFMMRAIDLFDVDIESNALDLTISNIKIIDQKAEMLIKKIIKELE
jgi:1-deoxy-D-xylulose-5-phosphate reductoisomerase